MDAVLLHELVPVVEARRLFDLADVEIFSSMASIPLRLLRLERMRSAILEEVEIFVLLPDGGLLAGLRLAVLLEPAQEAARSLRLSLRK